MSYPVKVTFLGTGTSQGVPVIGSDHPVCLSKDPKDKRLRSSILVEINNTNIVVDTGPDFRQQMLRAQVEKLDAVLFTHAHKDHTAGLDDIRPFNFKQKKDMEVYGQPIALDQIKKEFAYIFADFKYPGVPRVNLNEVGVEPFEIEGIPIIPIEVMHLKLPVLGYRFGDFTYITDANFISEESKELIKGSKVLVLNALRQTEHISHFTLQQAIDLADELKIKKAYFTHISHLMGFHAEVNNSLPENRYLAYDGLKITV